MKPYAELLEFNQPNPIRLHGFTRIRDAFPGLMHEQRLRGEPFDHFDHTMYDPERIMEFAGRGDYGEKNQQKLGETVKVSVSEGPPAWDIGMPSTSKTMDVPILRKYIDMGHQSMIEFGWATFYMEFSRVVLAELTRHRLASYQVESQRFVKYDDGRPVGLFYFPDGLDDVIIEEGYEGDWLDPAEDDYTAKDELQLAYDIGWEAYQKMRKAGVSPQLARYAIPNGFKTRMCMSANIREWRHILQLRLDKSAQPEMQELMQQVYDQLVMVFPNALYGVLDNGRGVR